MTDRRPFDSPWQTFRRLADYRGRSTRSELVYFWLLMAVAGYVMSFLTSFTRLAGHEGLKTLFLVAFLVPMAALLVRRLHDQGRSGWWLLAGLPALAALLFERWQRHTGGIGSVLDQGSSPSTIIGGLSAIAILLLALLPDNEAANPYGPNPRRGKAGETG